MNKIIQICECNCVLFCLTEDGKVWKRGEENREKEELNIAKPMQRRECWVQIDEKGKWEECEDLPF